MTALPTPPTTPTLITPQELARALPANLKNAATQALADKVNTIATEPEMAEQIRENFISYSFVLKDGRFKTEEYLNAVAYVSYKVMGLTNQEAYMRVFPDRYADLLVKYTPKDVASFVSAYNKGKLVNLILEQTLVPTWVLNQDMYQRALNESFSIGMDDEVSPKVRVEALNNVMTQLKKPEVKDFQINMNVNESSGLNELKESMKKLAETQRELIESGYSTKLIAGSPLIEGEFSEVGPDQTEPG